jgi:hypothetical protein
MPDLPTGDALQAAKTATVDVNVVDESLDVGSRVTICGRPEEGCVAEAIVLAILYPKPSASYAVVQIASNQVETVRAAARKAELRLRVVSY